MNSQRTPALLKLTHLRLRFLLAVVALLLLCGALTLVFLIGWHRRGDTFAMALGALLSFFASVITALVTLTYLHVSRRSLATAEAAISLQREQWQARITVQPRFWMGIRADAATGADTRFTPRPLSITYRHDRADGGDSFYDTVAWPQVAVDVWNDGERSFRLAGYRLWVRNEEHLAIERPLSGFVVPPNELRTFPVMQELIALSVRQRQFAERYERPPAEHTVVGLRLLYSDWREDDRSSRDDFYLLLSPPLAREFRLERVEPAE
ncbi:MAG TPA: hypothetical protein VHX13_04310 [Acidobacteriaceae bacterium]|jgi:uncharacterized membrane protein|nr:hypothetical protein [Acidobacteriaceae bacterium]